MVSSVMQVKGKWDLTRRLKAYMCAHVITSYILVLEHIIKDQAVKVLDRPIIQGPAEKPDDF